MGWNESDSEQVFDITFCGDWAGAVWGSSGCAGANPSCKWHLEYDLGCELDLADLISVKATHMLLANLSLSATRIGWLTRSRFTAFEALMGRAVAARWGFVYRLLLLLTVHICLFDCLDVAWRWNTVA
jgi:hypothetical protein